MIKVLGGDCLEILPTLDENSIDACVTDPPYHLISIVQRYGKGDAKTENSIKLHGTQKVSPYARGARGFMGKQWDGGDIAFRPETWAAVYRVLKPGAHLLAFGGTRTYHRMACAIEDAGFEIRDQIQWLYGSGFPKSHDVSKGIDRAAGEEREKIPRIRFDGKPTGYGGGTFNSNVHLTNAPPATDAARQWQGWGTALKPACEPIVLARKPLSEKTVAANVLKWGTGAINVDGCRVDCVAGDKGKWPITQRRHDDVTWTVQPVLTDNSKGRWPANVIHDGSEEVVGAFPDAKGAVSNGSKTQNGLAGTDTFKIHVRPQMPGYADEGSAARFFYCAKASKQDRNGSKHPTIKPLKLMRYLCRLITPPGGTILDPFAGSGTTGQAARNEGFRAVLIEREQEYQNDINRRLADGPLLSVGLN